MNPISSKDDLPREKLVRLGRVNLSNAELLAIFLRTGTRGKNVIELANELIYKAGNLESLGKMDAVEIIQLAKGIGNAKAATLAAVFELGSRAIREEVSKCKLDHPQYVYDLLITKTRWLTQETTYVILVDANLNLIKKIEISIGSLTETVAHPRDVLKPAIVHNAYGFIMAHNHPSGSANPSKADDVATNRLLEASLLLGIKFVDHIIIGKPGVQISGMPYFSYKENNRIL